MASLVDRDSAQQHQQPRRQPPAAQQQQQSPTRSPVAAAASKTQRSASTGAAAANAASDTDKPASTAKVSRKRTKTGCLTCRKRRIKCGEQRPTCNNCIKSKRICEGYNQRVVFKNISGSLQGRPFPGNASPFPIQPAPGVALLQPIAPAPPSSLGYRDEPITPLDQSLPPHLREHYAARQGHSPQYQVPGVTVPLGPPSEYVVDYGRHQSLHSPASHGAEVEEDHYGGGYYTAPNSATGASFPGMHGHHGHGGGGTVSEPSSASIYGPPPFQSPHSAHFPTSSSYGHAHSAAASPVSCPFNPPMDPKYVLSGGESVVQGGGSEFGGLFAQQRNMRSMMPVPEEFVQMTRDYDMENDDDDDDEDEDDEMEDEDEEDDDYDEQYHGQDANTSEYDYGFFYVDPRRPAGSSSQQQKQQQQLSNRARMTSYLQPYAGALTSQSRVSFRSFLPDHGSLTTYQPTLSNSPLMNPTTAKIFCHFVYVLGPSMSIFERYPPNPHIAFSPGTAASPGADTAGQNVWSYTLPMMSLHHPALLHAILALSSLNISKLQRGPAHPSMLHYHIALRRLGRAIASDKMRGHVATLAATLLLAYYESMAGEHDKWSSHVHGAKQLLKEIDFQRVAQRVAEVDAEEGQETRTGQPWGGEDGQQNRALALMQKRRLRESNAPPAGRRGARQKWRDPSAPPSPKEAEQLQLQADMFWFFAKMDAFQSILSGCPLILDHIHWSQCPPRARTGTLGMTHGSSDHFFHLLGKIADFQVRDAQRKKAVMRANGGVWIPPPDLRPPGDTSSAGPPPASSGCGRGNSTSSRGGTPPNLGRGATPPDMAGLIPTSHPPRLSRFFAENLPAASQPSPPHTSAPLPDSAAELSPLTAAAEREWAQLQSLLREYEASLGYEFRELKIEYAPLTSTPFGPPLYFRTYPIATLHMMLHMAHIILLRCHPSMPASIPMAIGVAAPRAALHALAIGQILAGLTPNAPLPSSPSTTTTATSSASTTHFFTNAAHQQITPALGGALIESTLPILFAAMQYQDATQRRWTVRRLREIHRLTGWATATRVMLGCQRAWEAAGRAGRGPKYEREAFADDEEGRLWEYGLSRAEAAREQVDMLVRGGGGGGGGAGGAGFMWRVSAARAARAVGVLGDEEEVVVGVAEISL